MTKVVVDVHSDNKEERLFTRRKRAMWVTSSCHMQQHVLHDIPAHKYLTRRQRINKSGTSLSGEALLFWG